MASASQWSPAPSAGLLGAELAKVLAYLITYMTLVFAVASVTRVVALGVILPFLFDFAVEGALTELANIDPRYLPLSSGTAFLTVDGLWLNWLFTACRDA